LTLSARSVRRFLRSFDTLKGAVKREHLTFAAKLEIGVRSQESGVRSQEEEGRKKEPEEVFLQI
jgi:hypothetical protein